MKKASLFILFIFLTSTKAYSLNICSNLFLEPKTLKNLGIDSELEQIMGSFFISGNKRYLQNKLSAFRAAENYISLAGVKKEISFLYQLHENGIVTQILKEDHLKKQADFFVALKYIVELKSITFGAISYREKIGNYEEVNNTVTERIKKAFMQIQATHKVLEPSIENKEGLIFINIKVPQIHMGQRDYFESALRNAAIKKLQQKSGNKILKSIIFNVHYSTDNHYIQLFKSGRHIISRNDEVSKIFIPGFKPAHLNINNKLIRIGHIEQQKILVHQLIRSGKTILKSNGKITLELKIALKELKNAFQYIEEDFKKIRLKIEYDPKQLTFTHQLTKKKLTNLATKILGINTSIELIDIKFSLPPN